MYLVILVLLGLNLLYLYYHRRKTDGVILITEHDGKKLFSLELNVDPLDMEHKKRVIFSVERSDRD
jgi:hypothetical protein